MRYGADRRGSRASASDLDDLARRRAGARAAGARHGCGGRDAAAACDRHPRGASLSTQLVGVSLFGLPSGLSSGGRGSLPCASRGRGRADRLARDLQSAGSSEAAWSGRCSERVDRRLAVSCS